MTAPPSYYAPSEIIDSPGSGAREPAAARICPQWPAAVLSRHSPVLILLFSFSRSPSPIHLFRSSFLTSIFSRSSSPVLLPPIHLLRSSFLPSIFSRSSSPVLLPPIHLLRSSFLPSIFSVPPSSRSSSPVLLPPFLLLPSSFLPSSFSCSSSPVLLLPSSFSFLLPPVQVRGFSSVYAGTFYVVFQIN